jgi:hypothetical protein
MQPTERAPAQFKFTLGFQTDDLAELVRASQEHPLGDGTAHAVVEHVVHVWAQARRLNRHYPASRSLDPMLYDALLDDRPSKVPPDM